MDILCRKPGDNFVYLSQNVSKMAKFPCKHPVNAISETVKSYNSAINTNAPDGRVFIYHVWLDSNTRQGGSTRSKKAEYRRFAIGEFCKGVKRSETIPHHPLSFLLCFAFADNSIGFQEDRI